ncbi:unnamed protein product, partial [Scytosiphon promiscuus]
QDLRRQHFRRGGQRRYAAGREGGTSRSICAVPLISRGCSGTSSDHQPKTSRFPCVWRWMIDHPARRQHSHCCGFVCTGSNTGPRVLGGLTQGLHVEFLAAMAGVFRPVRQPAIFPGSM